MKILRKNDEFKKMPDRNVQEILAINKYLSQGWKYCQKQVYKDFFNMEVKESKVKDVKVSDNDISKSKKEVKKVTKKRFENR